MKEPTRLFSEGGRLAEAIGRARQHTPDAASMRKIASGLSLHGIDVQTPSVPEPSQAAPTPAAPSPGTPLPVTPDAAKAGWSATTKAGLGIGGLVAVGLISGLLAQSPSVISDGSPEARDASIAVAAVQAPEAKAAPASASSPRGEAAPAAEVLEPAAIAEPSPAASVPAAHAQASGQVSGANAAGGEEPRNSGDTSPARRAHDRAKANEPSEVEAPLVNPETEISLLKRARETLAKNPGTSFSLAEEHRKTYAHGRLGQEREVIAITALMRLGRPTAARERADQFKRAYPRSAYLGQIERVVSGN